MALVLAACCVIPDQEFVGGGKLYLGGLEAAHRACGDNPAGIDLIIDCRGDLTKGRDQVPGVLRVLRGFVPLIIDTRVVV